MYISRCVRLCCVQPTYTRIFEVEFELLDKLSVPLLELVVEWPVDLIWVLVVTPRISEARQQCFGWGA